jgi:hypothetical protein
MESISHAASRIESENGKEKSEVLCDTTSCDLSTKFKASHVGERRLNVHRIQKPKSHEIRKDNKWKTITYLH